MTVIHTRVSPPFESNEQFARRWSGPIIDCVERGDSIISAPWEDPRFQEMIQRELFRLGEQVRVSAEDSRKIAVLKEIFGGHS